MKLVKKIVYPVTFLSVILLSAVVLQGDFQSFLRWWLAILVIGITALPMTAFMFRGFHDRGYLFSKTIGIALSGYLLWLLSSIKYMKFTATGGFVCIIILCLANLYLVLSKRFENVRKQVFSKEALEHFLNEELIFLVLFLIWCYIKGFRAEAYGTEKFMDYGFMTSMMRAEYMPPYDLWYAGGKLNYYYLGQYFATFLTKVSGVTVNYGYNLMLMTVATLSLLLPYSIVYNISRNLLKKRKVENSAVPYCSGVLGGLLVGASSNMHYPIFCWVVPALKEMLGLETKKYWFPDATRYIGYQPDTNDKTIHEFPAYSSVLGDLHAHYVNLIFVLTVIAILLAWYLFQDQYRRNTELGKKDAFKQLLIKELFDPRILMITFFIGLFHMTNFWDYPIYFVVSGAVILFSNAIRFQFNKKTWTLTLFQGAVVLLGSKLIALPFTLNFAQISTQIKLAQNHSRFYQLLILWGLPISICIGFLVSCINQYRQKCGKSQGQRSKVWNHIKMFLTNLESMDLFVILLALCAMGLVLMPEIIYVKDIYSVGYQRANTMFKLTYQSFILFGICNAYILVKLLVYGVNAYQRKLTRIALFLSVLTIGYLGHSINAWFGNIFDMKQRESLDAAAFIDEKFLEDAKLIAWLNENVKGTAVILEAHGDSYTDYERVSVITGLQTISGWGTHEWLWRGDKPDLNARNEDIETMYTSDDPALVKELLAKYGVEYIYVSSLERDKYEEVNDAVLLELGQVVYEEESEQYQGKMNYIVKIEK